MRLSLIRLLGTLAAAATVSSVMLMPQALAVESFSAAKRVLPGIYQQLDKEFGNTSTIYCGCDISYKKSGKKVRWSVDLDSCGYKVRKNKERASRIEVEHVMSAWEFGHQLKCWRDGGRKNCGDEKQFDLMEGDLHNLYPAIGEVNGDRGNFQFSDWNGKPSKYGKCQMVVDFKGKRAQPPVEARGPIARAHLYMADQYKIRLADQQKKLYLAWDKMYPATKMECRRNELITREQGNDNPYVTASCRLSSGK